MTILPAPMEGLLDASGADLSRELEALGGKAPQLLMLDHDIAGENGFDLLQRLRQRAGWDAFGAIMITGSTSGDIDQRAWALGVRVVHKPARPPVLRRVILRTLTESRSPEQTQAA
jgi:DNA-binding response OmpR family regulator